MGVWMPWILLLMFTPPPLQYRYYTINSVQINLLVTEKKLNMFKSSHTVDNLRWETSYLLSECPQNFVGSYWNNSAVLISKVLAFLTKWFFKKTDFRVFPIILNFFSIKRKGGPSLIIIMMIIMVIY